MAKEKDEQVQINPSPKPQIKEISPSEWDEHQAKGWIHLNTKVDAKGNKIYIIADGR